jgi:hypothetical protein
MNTLTPATDLDSIRLSCAAACRGAKVARVPFTPFVRIGGDMWRILSLGATRDDGMTFAHLASVSHGRQQRNGWCPFQMADWIDLEVEALGG